MKVDVGSRYDQYVVQTIWTGYQAWRGCYVKRIRVQGVWQPWEWVNPPLIPGVEYRTTRRWNKRPVYEKSINTGALSAGTTKSVAHGVENIYYRLGVIYSVDNDMDNLLGNPGVAGIVIDGQNIVITTAEGYSTTNSWVVIAYTKTTD